MWYVCLPWGSLGLENDAELSSWFWKAVLAGRGEEVTDDKKGG